MTAPHCDHPALRHPVRRKPPVGLIAARRATPPTLRLHRHQSQHQTNSARRAAPVSISPHPEHRDATTSANHRRTPPAVGGPSQVEAEPVIEWNMMLRPAARDAAQGTSHREARVAKRAAPAGGPNETSQSVTQSVSEE